MNQATFDVWSEHIILGYAHGLQHVHRIKGCPVRECKAKACGGACHLCLALAVVRLAVKDNDDYSKR